jgi:hypothetical protein
MTVQAIIAELFLAGGWIIPDPDSLRLMVPPRLRGLIHDHRDELKAMVDLKEMARRAEYFRKQIADWARSGGVAVPLLTLAERARPGTRLLRVLRRARGREALAVPDMHCGRLRRSSPNGDGHQ